MKLCEEKGREREKTKRKRGLLWNFELWKLLKQMLEIRFQNEAWADLEVN